MAQFSRSEAVEGKRGECLVEVTLRGLGGDTTVKGIQWQEADANEQRIDNRNKPGWFQNVFPALIFTAFASRGSAPR